MQRAEFDQALEELQDTFQKWTGGKQAQLFSRVQYYTADSFRQACDSMIRGSDNNPSIAKILNWLIENGRGTLTGEINVCPRCDNSGWVHFVKSTDRGSMNYAAVCICDCNNSQKLRRLNEFQSITEAFSGYAEQS